MQGRDDGERQLLDVEALAGHLVPAGSVFAFLALHRHDLFPDDAFEDSFPSGCGRPSVPADVIAAVMVLQTLHSIFAADTGLGLLTRTSKRFRNSTGRWLNARSRG